MFKKTSRALALIGGALASAAFCAPASAAIKDNFVGASGGVLMSVIAFSIVFLIICGLMVMMMILKKVVNAINTTEKPAPAPAAKAAPAAPAAAPAPAASAHSEDEAELIAVITAAIAAMVPGSSPKIVAFAPVEEPRGGITAWRLDGIAGNSEGLF